tara:strand:+ start:1526 stop:1825 length:300 start_codon:yes stop_codon:yes gene_type:complete
LKRRIIKPKLAIFLFNSLLLLIGQNNSQKLLSLKPILYRKPKYFNQYSLGKIIDTKSFNKRAAKSYRKTHILKQKIRQIHAINASKTSIQDKQLKNNQY